MAKGYPDFFGFSVFPQFGPFQNEVINKVVASGASGDIVNISDKGNIYSGYFDISSVRLQSIFINLIVDGTSVAYLSPQALLIRGHNSALDLPFILTLYETVTGMATIVIQSDITFSSSYRIEIQNTTIADATMSGNALWSKVI